MSKLDAALAWAGRGFKIFPLIEDSKIPLFSDWPERATTDASQIRRWWQDEIVGIVRDYNIASDCSDLLVVDLDCKNGKNGLKEFEAMGGRIDDTLVVKTPTGGFHAYFDSAGLDIANSAGTIAPGIDIRGHRGYAVAPGSVIDDVAYTIEVDAPVNDAPTFIWQGVKLAEIRRSAPTSEIEKDTPSARSAAIAAAIDTEPAIEGAGGDLKTYQTACTIRDLGVSEATALDILLEHWNPRCEPPWHPDELAAKVGNAYTYAQRGEGEKSPAAMFEGVVLPPPEYGQQTQRLTLVSVEACGEITARKRYVVKGLISAGDIGCIFGQPGAGKSILAPHVAYAVAQGRPAFGRRTKPGLVFYVPAEDATGIRARLDALRTRYGTTPQLFLVDGFKGSLLSAEWKNELVALIEAHKPVLVIIDTLNASCPGMDENSSVDMGKAVSAARDLTTYGAAVILVHHDSKAEGGTPRGHSALNGSLDMALLVQRHSKGQVICQLTKNRNGTSDEKMGFTIEVEHLGYDEDNDPLSAPIARELTPADLKPVHKLPAQQQALLMTLCELAEQRGLDGNPGVTVADLKLACRDTISPTGTEDTKRRRFNEAIKALREDGIIIVRDGHVWESRAIADFDNVNVPDTNGLIDGGVNQRADLLN